MLDARSGSDPPRGVRATLDVDRTSLSDLEVFRTTAGAAGVVQLLDRTVTPAGARALQRRLAAPPADADGVRAAQSASRFFQDHPRAFHLDAAALGRVERYLGSNIWVRSGSAWTRWPEQVWLRLRFRDLDREIRSGLSATVQFARQIRRVTERVTASGPPPDLAADVERLDRAAEAVLEARAAARLVLSADQAIRVGQEGGLREMLAVLAEWEAYRALGEVTRELGWCRPEVEDGDAFRLEADDLVHPLVDGAVPNPVRIGPDAPAVFLTGPNMAGKTTWLRAVGLSVVLAQSGCGVPATRMRFTPADALLMSLHPVDSVQEGRSTFLAEVLRVREAATLLADDRRALVIFDEVFRGTNVRDALDASERVARAFARARRGVAILSSHLVELADALDEDVGVRFLRFPGEVAGGEPRFPYRLEDGVSDRRFGLLLFEGAGLPALLDRIGGE